MAKKKVGIIASAIASCAICASIIAGSTLALFTSNSGVDITIKSGKVDVVSSIENAKLTRATSVTETEADYTDAVSTAVETDGKSIDFDKFIPGDKLDFDITFENKGTIAAKYQYKLACTEGYALMSELDVEITAEEEGVWSGTHLRSYQSAWGTIEAADTVTYHVTLALPVGLGDDYADLASKLQTSTFAVQYNAKVDGDEKVETIVIPEGTKVIEVRNEDELWAAWDLNNVYIIMLNDIDKTKSTIIGKGDFTLDLNGYTLSGKGMTIGAYQYLGTGGGINATICNGTIDASASALICYGDASVVTLKDLTIKSKGTQAVYVGYGDKCVIENGTYETNYVWGTSDKAESDGYVNFGYDLKANKLIDTAGKEYEFESVELVYIPESYGICVKLGAQISSDELPYGKVNDEGYLVTKSGNIALVNRFLLNLKDGQGSKIETHGGIYKNYNPTCNYSESDHESFGAAGYAVVYKKDADGDYWFNVIEQSQVDAYVANGYIMA